MEPFLKWCGNKTKLYATISATFPEGWRERVWVEPFVGSGAMFMKANPSRLIISDRNRRLVNVWQQVRDNCPSLVASLRQLADDWSELQFNILRDEFNSMTHDTPRAAAIFVWLNRCSWGGVYRVNLKGCYNVPRNKELKACPDVLALITKIEATSAWFGSRQSLEICCEPADMLLGRASRDWFVYMDPPYLETSKKSQYVEEKFGIEQLTAMVETLRVADWPWVMSNSPDARPLFEGMNIVEIERSAGLRRKNGAAEIVISCGGK